MIAHSPLGSIAAIATGQTVRGATSDPRSSSGLGYLTQGQLPHALSFGVDGEAGPHDPAELRWVLHPGDVVFSGRGEVRASVYRGTEGALVALAPLLIVRVDEARAVPEFIALQIGSSRNIERLRSRMQGSAIRFVTKSELVELEIPLPPLATQHRIVELRRLQDRERELHEALQAARNRMLDVALSGAASSRETGRTVTEE